MAARLSHRRHRFLEVFHANCGGRFPLGLGDGLGERALLRGAGRELRVGRTGVFAFVLFLLGTDDVRRTAIAGEEIFPVLGIEELSPAPRRGER